MTNIKLILEEMKDENWKTWWSDAVNRAPNFEEAFFAYLFKMNGLKVEREYVIGKYPLDFAVPNNCVGIEIDSPTCRGRGGKNSKKKKADRKKQYLEKRGWSVHQVRWWRQPFGQNRKHTQKEIEKVLNLVIESV